MINSSSIIVSFANFCIQNKLNYKKDFVIFRGDKNQSYTITNNNKLKCDLIFKNEFEELVIIIMFMHCYGELQTLLRRIYVNKINNKYNCFIENGNGVIMLIYDQEQISLIIKKWILTR